VTSLSFNWIVLLPNLGSGQIMREWWTEHQRHHGALS
jgi:hypothetical protein